MNDNDKTTLNSSKTSGDANLEDNVRDNTGPAPWLGVTDPSGPMSLVELQYHDYLRKQRELKCQSLGKRHSSVLPSRRTDKKARHARLTSVLEGALTVASSVSPWWEEGGEDDAVNNGKNNSSAGDYKKPGGESDKQ